MALLSKSLICFDIKRLSLNLCNVYNVLSASNNINEWQTNGNFCRLYSSQSRNQNKDNKYLSFGFGSLLTGFTAFTLFWINERKYKLKANLDSNDSNDNQFGAHINGLKTYTSQEVVKHNQKSTRIWVSFKSGVYDITDFVDKHPGGDQILMAAGGALEPFWTLFAAHKNKKVMQLLENYRIGNLCPNDRTTSDDTNDPFVNEPQRHPVLKVRSAKPFNAETPEELLTQKFLTPNEIFFVRNHLPVPEVDVNNYSIQIEGFGLKTCKTLTLDEIKAKFPKHSVVVTIQCSGNRRNQMNKFKEVKGLSWESGAIGNAEWSGALLTDVLKYCQLDFNDPNIKHIQFEGLDYDVSSMPYGASVEALKALDPNSKFVLAYEMNGKEIPLDHGFPLRLIAPGVTGARNVKWLSRIVLSNEESESHWQRRDYKSFSPNVDWHNVDFESAPSIQEVPVQSAICIPKDGQTVRVNRETQTIEIQGYAFSGGGRKVIRIDVSCDNANNWTTGELIQESTPLNQTFSWTLWKANIAVPKDWKCGDKLQVICKATDSHYNSQPESAKHIWNLRGVLNNSWHSIDVYLQ